MPDPAPLAGLKLELAVSSGIPEAIAAGFNYAARVRDTMDPALLRRLDAMNVWAAEQFWAVFGYRPGA